MTAMGASATVALVWDIGVPAAVSWMGRKRPDTHADPRYKFPFGEALLSVPLTVDM